ncbi:MAG: PilX N-terminal domain-containing pilus assembly protein [Candidatus Aminicenantales bacterium]
MRKFFKEKRGMPKPSPSFPDGERGAALIIVILVLAFLLAIGVVLLTVTGTGPKVAGNIRTQHQAFNAAEAGFDASWLAIENLFVNEAWTSFDGHYLRDPYGIDLPTDNNYFRKLTDSELLNLLDPDGDGNCDYDNVLFFQQPYHVDENGDLDTRYMYTAFLIDDEAGGGSADPGDALLVCIGVFTLGSNVTTSRLEVGLAIELPGTTY